jgi:hypothetical protein
LDPVVGKDARRTCFLARRRELDATFEVERPEWRVYAANPDGDGVRLVAVECAVPLELSDRAPEGFAGRRDEWHRAEEFGLWTLHAWVWLWNPDGVLAESSPYVP